MFRKIKLDWCVRCPCVHCPPTHHRFLLTSYTCNLICSNLQDASKRCLEAEIGQKYFYVGERNALFENINDEKSWPVAVHFLLISTQPCESKWREYMHTGHLSCWWSTAITVEQFLDFFRGSIFERLPSYLWEQQCPLLHICSWIHSSPFPTDRLGFGG